MKKKMLFLAILWMLGTNLVFAEAAAVIADFDNGEAVSNLGQSFEVWLKGDGSDKTQSCEISFVDGDATGADAGQVLRVDYDVDSEEPAYNGMRFNFEGYDASAFKSLSFYVKGDEEQGFSQNLKIEMIGSNKRPSPVIVPAVTSDWQKITIPFSDFFGIRDWSSLHQLVIVFADIVNDPKVGTFYFDQFTFE